MVRAQSTSEVNHAELRKMAEYLNTGAGTFIWSTSDQGHDYWHQVRKNLLAIADEVDHENKCSACGQKVLESK